MRSLTFIVLYFFLVFNTCYGFCYISPIGNNWKILSHGKHLNSKFAQAFNVDEKLIVKSFENDAKDSSSGFNSTDITRRASTGLLLAMVGSGCIWFGKYAFLPGFMGFSWLAFREYSSMLQAVNISFSFWLCYCASLLPLFAATIFPMFHQFSLPASIILLFVSFIFWRKSLTPIKEIAASLLGVLLFGYMPSFWILLRQWNFQVDVNFDFNAAFIWWTWATIVASDIGAYFAGKCFGKHKLSSLGSAAGLISPKKTVEGLLGGIFSSVIVSLVGAKVIRCNSWPPLSILYGIIIGCASFIGDLSISLLKRDANMKDSGNILPGHGGVLDRFDSFILTAPAALMFVLILGIFAGS